MNIATNYSYSHFYSLLIDVVGCNIFDELAYLVDLIYGIFLRHFFSLNSILPGYLLFKDVLIRVKSRENCLFYCPAKTDALMSLLPYSEPRTFNFIKSIVKPGDIFVDVGAFIGSYAIPIAKYLRPRGMVIAIEPSPICRILKKNVEINRLNNVLVINKAAYSENHIIDFYYNPVFSGGSRIHKISNSNKIKIHAEPLDDILNDIIESSREIKVLKIDVEGSELHVIKGAQDTLKRTKCVIFEARKETIKSCIEELSKLNFDIRLLEVISKNKVYNYLAIRS